MNLDQIEFEIKKVRESRDYWATKQQEAKDRVAALDIRRAELAKMKFLETNKARIVSDKEEQLALMFRCICFLQSDQHPDAIVDHLGFGCAYAFSFCGLEYVTVQMCPVTTQGYPSFCFESQYENFDDKSLEYIRGLISAFYPIRDEWGGFWVKEPTDEIFYLSTFSISPFMQLSDSVMTARKNYTFYHNFNYSDPDWIRRCALLEKPLGWDRYAPRHN